MKGFPRRGSDRRHARVRPVLEPASMKGFPRRGSDSPAPPHTPGLSPASMKGFPRRGSDRILRQGNQNPQIRLNEGLPQKGKRSLALAEQAYWRTGASMKGFPRRGSDRLVERHLGCRVHMPQ